MNSTFTNKASAILKDFSNRVGEKKCFEIQKETYFIHKMNEFLLLSFTSYQAPKSTDLINFIEKSQGFKYRDNFEKLFIAIVFLYKWHKDVNQDLGIADDNQLYKILIELEIKYGLKNRNFQIHSTKVNTTPPINTPTITSTYNANEKKNSPKYFIIGLLSLAIFIFLAQDIDTYNDIQANMVGIGIFISLFGTIAGFGYWRTN